MIDTLPNEVFWLVLNHLDYQDMEQLQLISPLSKTALHYTQQHYPFHYKINSLLRLFEAITPSERQSKDTKLEFSQQILQQICKQVEILPKMDHRAKFTELLDIVQQFIVARILSPDLKSGIEHDYANLCLEIRSQYLHTPSIRVLHDPKYRRRSTKHPLAPFLPRDYTSIWRHHCATPHTPIHTRFALFFGSLFDVTSLYLESNLDGSFEECAREALVTGNVEDLLIMCVAADRPVDVDRMCMMVTHAGEQLRHYLETMDTWVTTEPTPQQELRMQQNQQLLQNESHATAAVAAMPPSSYSPSSSDPPEWLIPDRYKVQPDTILRLRLMDNLYKKGWHWFQ
ncbi:hypothetical protein V8B55DRAFT_1477768 [Mucor lusitanicus]|uniref:F-box domain-containing protein n=2 Tax=Mucor circinelloides f. lusitanicus TaxID=29924 RepID=A0A162YH19_MUCCL|nr:hypothetical protein FB192DRAFT_1376691 [Mucor lusitanicus]OAC98626.1 hypothetical protein MUCCIDRAFT_167692 [Mucor lusitanicus CBS 277.49]